MIRRKKNNAKEKQNDSTVKLKNGKSIPAALMKKLKTQISRNEQRK